MDSTAAALPDRAKLEADFRYFAKNRRLDPDWLGSTFQGLQGTLKVIGLNAAAPILGVITENVKSGRIQAFAPEYIRNMLGRGRLDLMPAKFANTADMRLAAASEPREFIELRQRHLRMTDRLEAVGLLLNFKSPGPYERGDSKVLVSGNTYAHLALMKKYGFKWDGAKKSWWLPASQYTAVGDKWLGEVLRDQPKKPSEPPAKAVFSEMSQPGLLKFLDPLVLADMEANEWYDGEVTASQVLADLRHRLLKMSPVEQTAFYQKAMGRNP